MRLLVVLLWLTGAGGGIALGKDTPLPKPRPPLWSEPQSFREAAGLDFNSADVTSMPTDCDQRLKTIAAIEPMPRLIGPDACGGGDMVRLDAVLLVGGKRIELRPAPMLRCAFAEISHHLASRRSSAVCGQARIDPEHSRNLAP